MALHSMPRTTLKDPRLGELGVRWASSNIAARPVAEVFAADVLGNSQINPVEFGAALTEDNLRSVKQAFLDAADEAENRKELIDDLREQIADIKGMGDEEVPEIRQQMDAMRREIRRLSKLTDEDVARFRAKADQVKSFIGAGNFPFKSEDAYQNYLKKPEVQEAVNRHIDLWKQQVEPQYRAAMSIDPEIELPSRGLQTGARINLYAAMEGDQGPNIVSSVRRGNLLGTIGGARRSGFRPKGRAKPTMLITTTSWRTPTAGSLRWRTKTPSRTPWSPLARRWWIGPASR